jgi:hypothetical protein
MSWSEIARVFASRALPWLAVAIAFSLALRPPVLILAGKASLPKNDISSVEAEFWKLGQAIPVEARIGWLLPREAPGAISAWMAVSQYALVPRRLANIDMQACTRNGRDACGASAVELLLVPDLRAYSSVDEARELGFRVAPHPLGQPVVVAERAR